MPETFIADLQADVDAFASAIALRESGRTSRNEARARVEAALAEGLAAVRQLDAIVHNGLSDGDPLLVAWRKDSVIGPTSRRQKRPAATPSAPQTTADVLNKEDAA